MLNLQQMLFNQLNLQDMLLKSVLFKK